MTTTKEKYSKDVLSFTSTEWALVGNSLGEAAEFDSQYDNKRKFIHYIYNKYKAEFADLSKKYFFKICEREGIEYVHHVTDPMHESQYTPKLNGRWTFTTEAFNAIVSAEPATFKTASLPVQKAKHISEDSLNNLPIGDENRDTHVVQNNVIRQFPESSKGQIPQNNYVSGLYKQKLKYTADTEINRFLKQVETYASANNCYADHEKIAITLAALNQCDEGAMAHELCDMQELSEWHLLKLKLIKILGHSPEYYRQQFTSYKRKSGEKLGLTLSKLTQFFKRGWEISRLLTMIESDMVKSRFIDSLEGNIQVMLKTEEHRLTLDTILERAIQLETCFNGPSATISAIRPKPEVPDKMTEILSALQNDHREMLKIQKKCTEDLKTCMNGISQIKTGSNSKTESKPSRRRNDPAVYKVLNGLCAFFVKGKTCRREDCKYKHDGEITEEQRKAVGLN